MTIKSASFKEFVAMMTCDPKRKYRKLNDSNGTIILEEEAQELRMGERNTLSVAYVILSEPADLCDNATLVEIKDKKRLEEIASSFSEGKIAEGLHCSDIDQY